jgi:hypothetical protein
MTTTRPGPTTDAGADVRRAWWSFALFALSFVAAMVTGEGLAAAMGYADPEAEVPVGAALAAGLPACLVFALPALVVTRYGRRAVRRGRPDGRTPVVVSWTVAGGFLALNLVQLVALLVIRLFG